MTDNNNNTSPAAKNLSYVDDYAPPVSPFSGNGIASRITSSNKPGTSDAPAASSAPASPMPAAPAKPAEDKISQTLEDQNIFNLLGLDAATDDEKEAFLDELQQVIWEDFLENDVDLLLTEEELEDFKKISAKKDLSEEDRQAEMIDFLEKLIPDLEKIMLEKALELKEEMFRERIAELLEAYKNNADLLKKVQSAQELVEDQQWRSAADTLNSI